MGNVYDDCGFHTSQHSDHQLCTEKLPEGGPLGQTLDRDDRGQNEDYASSGISLTCAGLRMYVVAFLLVLVMYVLLVPSLWHGNLIIVDTLRDETD
ncbi:hypothetical protein CF327_g3803 [Tilletia walkeri]|nr:hypothetical protein CF327_g3803 [Tilletia walkeri]